MRLFRLEWSISPSVLNIKERGVCALPSLDDIELRQIMWDVIPCPTCMANSFFFRGMKPSIQVTTRIKSFKVCFN